MGTIRTEQQVREPVLALQPLVKGLVQLPKPAVAAVDGVAYGVGVGVGLGVALSTDLAVAGEGGRFCCSFGRVGLVPDFAVHAPASWQAAWLTTHQRRSHWPSRCWRLRSRQPRRDAALEANADRVRQKDAVQRFAAKEPPKFSWPKTALV